MKIAIVAGGFEPWEADQLRRAMATFRRNGTIQLYRDRMISGMVSRGYEKEFAERCFAQIEGFGDYGFPESHAASFALLVYASCWFKTFYPDVFCAAILNSQPMGFYAPAQLVRDAADHGVGIRPVDINASQWDCTLEKAVFDPSAINRRHQEMKTVIRSRHAVRLGFRQVKGLAEKAMTRLVENRGDGYRDVRDVWLRSGLDRGALEKLADADAFRSIGLDRRAALWAVRGLGEAAAARNLPLLDRPDIERAEPETKLPIMPLGEHVIHDYRSLGLSLKAHPLSFLRQGLDKAGVTPNARLADTASGRKVTVAGLVLVRQRPGKGNAIFLTLEDEAAIANVIVWQRDFDRFRPVIMGGKLLSVTGRLQNEAGVVHIVAQQMHDLSWQLGALSETAAKLAFEGPADEVRRGIDQDRRALAAAGLVRRNGQSPAVINAGEHTALSEQVNKVMPKGRNFH